MEIRLLDRAFYAGDPYPVYAWLRTNDPVFWDATTGIWGLSLHEDVVWAEKHPELFSNARGSRPRSDPQPSMIDCDDPRHGAQRRIVYKGFTPKRVAEYEPHVRAIAKELVDAVAPAGRCDVVKDLAAPLPMILIAEMLGVPVEDRELLQTWSDTLISGADGPENVTDDVVTSAVDFYEYAGAIIRDRKRAPRDDLISALVHAEIDGHQLTEDQLLAESLLLLIGGNETTRNVISGGIEALIAHPGERRQLLADPGLLPCAVEECLRWVTPVLNMARTATTDIELRGRTIHAGDQLLLMYGSANRDERVFDEPERFDVDREPNHHVAFGFGGHFCLGASLARLELRVMLDEVVRRLPDMELAPDAMASRTPSSFIRGLTSLPVEFTSAES